MKLNEFAKSFICLGLRINKHIGGYVDHYYGPPDLKKAIDTELITSPRKLFKDSVALLDKLKDQGFEEKRQKYLQKTIIAIQTILRKLMEEEIPYLEFVKNLFDFTPKLYEDEFFYDLSSKAEELYKGKGDLASRMKRYVKRRTIPTKLIITQYIKVLEIARNQTKKFFPDLLPDYERVDVSEVRDRSWPLSCWYLGNSISRLEINIEKVHYWTNLLNYACHEAYPGHHMERLIREHFLFRYRDYFESSVLLIYTPEIVIAEGLGVLAETTIFDYNESSKILLDQFCPNPKNEDSIEILTAQCEIREGFRRFESNLAYHKYVNNWSNDELIKYSKDFKAVPDEGIKAILEFISDDLWAPYAFVYQGERIISDKLGNKLTPRQFLKLAAEQTLPSDLL
ncbi:MAG: hypothetical protein ACFFFB_06405 [Candidatus Heimdallarchaeota archaeon]